MIENNDCRLKFLLPYSPDFHPIEHSFACLKRELKSGNYILDNEDRVRFAGGASSLAVCSALVASFCSPRENGENKPVGENGENTPVGDDGGNRPVRKHKPVGKKSPVGDDGGNRAVRKHKPVGKKSPVGEDGEDGEDIPVGYS